jgi:hypothetical protein
VGTGTQGNQFVLLYFDWLYDKQTPELLAVAEQRVDDTFDALSRALIPPIGDIAGQPTVDLFTYCREVRMVMHPSGPYVRWGEQDWIGCIFEFNLIQEY